jgi:diguanylate cyclase (GGDEF)-like protein/PAS domain S-box-containing protein
MMEDAPLVPGADSSQSSLDSSLSTSSFSPFLPYSALHPAELAACVLEQAADVIEVIDLQNHLVYVNAAFERITGYCREEVLGKPPTDFLQAGRHDDSFYEEIWQTISSGRIWAGTCRSKRKDGSTYYQDVTLFPIYSSKGNITHYVAIKRDISDRHQTQVKLEKSLSLLQATLESTADGILVIDKTGQIQGFNQKFLEMWKISPDSAAQKSQTVLFNGMLAQLTTATFLDQFQTWAKQPEATDEDTLRLKDGRIFEQYSHPQWLNGEISGRVLSFRDATARHSNEALIRYQASHDPLTGLPNRTLFDQRLSEALEQAQQNQSQLAVVFLDLDRFKNINDTLGHAAGDLLLQGVAVRLTESLRDSDIVARWAGDEFTLLLPQVHEIADATAIAQRILDSLREEFDLEGHLLRISSSIGIAFYPQDGEDAETLLKNADAALYRAKESGRNTYHLYTAAINTQVSEQLILENYLHRALERGEFAVHYQPRVNVVTGKITHMETVLRWQHPTLGLVPPEKFMPLAEETGLIMPIGEWLLQTACMQNTSWQDLGISPLRVTVNLSTQQFGQPRMLDVIQQVLEQTGLAPRYLELEITETTVGKQIERTQAILTKLHRLGVAIALDDFGTGYSSLSYLKKFPIQTLKIDSSFIRHLTTDLSDKAIVTAIIALGKVLNLNLVAEGVENEVQEYLLRSLGCEEMQGSLFSPPLPAEAATLFLQTAPFRDTSCPIA